MDIKVLFYSSSMNKQKSSYKIAYTSIIMAINTALYATNGYAQQATAEPQTTEAKTDIKNTSDSLIKKSLSTNVEHTANTAEYTVLEPVIVTAAKVEQKLPKALPTTLAINLQKSNPNITSVVDVLRQQLGMELKQLGGVGGQTSLFMRSAGSSQSLVLLDGVPINSLSSGGTSIERLSLNNIASAEAVLGSVSSLYGSNAMGGVLSLSSLPKSTTKETKYSVDVKAKGGTDSTYGVNAGLNGQYYNQESHALTSYGLKVSGFETDGIDAMDKKAYPNSNPDKDGFSQRGASVYLQHQQNNNSIGITAGTTKSKGEYDNAYAMPTDTHKYKSTFNNFGLNLTSKFSSQLQGKVILGYNQEDATDYKNDKKTSEYTNTNKYASAQLDYFVNPENVVSLQAERLNQDLESNSKYKKNDRQTNSLRLGYVGQIDAHSIQANVRYDDVSDIKKAVTYFTGYGFNLNPAWKVFATHSTGFRVASFNELYGPFGGNQDLNPEKSKNVELGVQYAQSGIFWRTSIYQNRYTDLIGYDMNYKPININKAKISGIESLVKANIDKLNVYAGLNLQNPQQIDVTPQGEQKSTLLLRAKLFGNLGANYKFNAQGRDLTIGGNLQFTGDRQDYGRQKLGGYALLDLNLDYALTKELALQIGIKNALNRKGIFDAYGYNKPERKAFVQISYTSK
ncbi:MAG: hypothetical protein RLZZ210_522 [Pseudomonadota bacterium]|jgi:vitamin B12 transporter